MSKERVDVLLVKQGFFATREKAKRAVMAGLVMDDHQERLDKPGVKIDDNTILNVKGDPVPYVSRGGLKLARALSEFDLDLNNKIGLDIGSSTGGFTDVMLKNGINKVYALDVGTNQLVWKLRQDERVIVMENTNFRYSKLTDFNQGQPDFASIDVSFISLKLILPTLKTILKNKGSLIALIKPQFEAGRDKVGKKGIVSDPKVHYSVLESILNLSIDLGYSIQGLTFSPIKGGEGNIEFLLWLTNYIDSSNNNQIDISQVLEETYQSLKDHNN